MSSEELDASMKALDLMLNFFLPVAFVVVVFAVAIAIEKP
jgi:hypothetical protein